MDTTEDRMITVQCRVSVPIEKAWQLWTGEEHIVQWNQASDEWHTPEARNDLRPGGKFCYRMEARDGSAGFDFEGEYTFVEQHRQILSVLGDGRKVKVTFSEEGGQTIVKETFEAESMNSTELQRQGWQSILDSFSGYAERSKTLNTLRFEINIQAPVRKVYDTMLDENHYRTWTRVFNAESRFVGSWKKGSGMQFLGAEADGSFGGMISTIRENIPGVYVSIEHLGFVKNGEQITSGDPFDGWQGARENYTFVDTAGSTKLRVDLDTKPEYQDYFNTTWPEALSSLKSLCEA